MGKNYEIMKKIKNPMNKAERQEKSEQKSSEAKSKPSKFKSQAEEVSKLKNFIIPIPMDEDDIQVKIQSEDEFDSTKSISNKKTW